MEDGVGIPEDLRCKRSDGKQWRCSALSMPDKTVCEKHYIQAKKRAANSALRASLKKAKHRKSAAAAAAPTADDDSVGGDAYHLDDGGGGDHEVREMSLSPPVNDGGGGVEYSGMPSKKYKKERAHKRQGFYATGVMKTKHGPSARVSHGEEAQRDLMQVSENRSRPSYRTHPATKPARAFGSIFPGEYSSKSTDSSGEAEGLTCHQCLRNDRARVVWCMSCNKRGYCDVCVARRYPDISMEDIRRVCPACRGICNCRLCLRGDNLIKARIREMAGMEKLQHLHRLLFFILPILKQIHAEQCFELNVETGVYGIQNDIPRAKINADEQMCCDFCRIPIFDYHRHCTNCLYDLCLTCCRDLRRASLVGAKGKFTENQAVDGRQDRDAATMHLKSLEKSSGGEHLGHSIDEYAIDFYRLHPKWKANSDNKIPCPPVEAGGCGCSSLVLRRILKINWVAKLVKVAEEMVNGCKASDLYTLEKCDSCTGGTTSQSSDPNLCQCSHRDDGRDNFLYYPTSLDIEHENVGHFHKHWAKGEPVIVRHTFECSLSSCWDPLSIWRGIQETADEGMREDDVIVKAISFFNHSEVDIELSQFIKGYTEGHIDEFGRPEMLKLKDWPPADAAEEFLLCQRPEFLSKLPLLEYIHPKWGLLNLAAKLPHDTMQTDVGPKIFIAYGTREELGRGDSTRNLQINMGDLVCLLMHTSDVSFQGRKWRRFQNIQQKDDESDTRVSHGNAHTDTSNQDLHERVNSSISATNEHGMQDQVCGTALNEKGEDKVCKGIGSAPEGSNKVDSYHSDKGLLAVPENVNAGAVWDVFRRQDVPKLNEYLRSHWKELSDPSSPPFNSVTHSIYDQGLFLSMDHKRKLKEEFRVDPWSFRQHVGEAVVIPAGCPFQVRNLQSTVQLGFDFLSPESLGESVHLAQEIRCLPNDHEAKLQMLEVGKMCLYAASSAVREIQKITLDSKLDSDVSRFEDRNLTAMVSENLHRMTKGRQITCS